MSGLASRSCEACRVGAPLATEEEISVYLRELPGWELVEVDGISRLKRVYDFSDFAEALEFTNKVGAVAEAEGHHPALMTEWGSVTVVWWTHKIGGVHANDFVMAARTDELL